MVPDFILYARRASNLSTGDRCPRRMVVRISQSQQYAQTIIWKKGSLSSSLFNKLIKSIPFLCLYPNRLILPVELRNQTPVLVTGIENSLRDAVGSDDHYCFHKAVATFNTNFLCHFVKRVALCLLLAHHQGNKR